MTAEKLIDELLEVRPFPGASQFTLRPDEEKIHKIVSKHSGRIVKADAKKSLWFVKFKNVVDVENFQTAAIDIGYSTWTLPSNHLTVKISPRR